MAIIWLAGGVDAPLGHGLREAESDAQPAQLHAGDAAGAALHTPAGGPALRRPRLVRYRHPSGQAHQELHTGFSLQGTYVLYVPTHFLVGRYLPVTYFKGPVACDF